MTDYEPDNHLTEEDAARLWQRAAHLQAEAAQKAEAADVEEAMASTDVARTDGYQVEHVRAAAVEAGIGAEYLDAALVDLRAEEALPPKSHSRFSRRFLNNPPDAITVRRTIDAPGADVLKAMEEIVPNEPYNLRLIDRQGDPLMGGLLIFDIEGAGFTISEGFKGQASAADLRQVFVSIRPVEDGASCELTLRGPVAWAFGLTTAVGSAMVGLVSGLGGFASWNFGGFAGAALGGLIGGPAAAVLAAAIAAGGTGTAAGLALKGFRMLYDHEHGKGRKGLEGLASQVAIRAQGGWGILDGDSGEASGSGGISVVG